MAWRAAAYADLVSARIGILAALASIALLGAMVWFVPDLRNAVDAALSGDTDELRARLEGPEGVVLLFTVALVHAVVWFPSEILNAAAGFVWGFWLGTLLVHVAWIVSGLATYGLGRALGRPGLKRVVGRRRLSRFERSLERGGVPVLLGARLIPIVPVSFAGLVCGAAKVPLWRFTWTTAVGYLPLTAAGVLIGERLENFSLTDPVLWAAIVPILALIVLARPLARRLRLDDPD